MLWASHYYLGELFYSIEQYSDAKIEFEKAREIKPDREAAKYYLTEISSIESGISIPRDLEEVMKMVNNPVLLNHALIEWFENNAIMHCRGQYLSSERISRLKESCIELQKLVQKVEQREK